MLTRDNQALHTTSQVTKCLHLVRAALCLILCAVPFFVFGPTVSPRAGSPFPLQSGVLVTEQLSAKAEKEFQISLRQGELLLFSIVKGDLNVSVAVHDSLGHQVLEYLSHSYEPIRLSVVAETSGVYLLKVRSIETGARQGQISLTTEPVRQASGDDLKNAAANLAIATATRLCSEWREQSFRKALDKYTEAASMAVDPRIAAVAMFKAGETYSVLGEYKKALERFEGAATLSEKAGESQDAQTATTEAARLYSLLGNKEKAQNELSRVLKFYSNRNIEHETPATKHVYALALSSQGEILHSKGYAILSLQRFDRALKLLEELGDRYAQARALLLTGHLNNMVSQHDRAMAHFSRAYELYREIGNKSGEALTTTAQGLTRSYKQVDEQVIELHRDARSILQEIGDHQSEAITLNAIGEAYTRLNQAQLALDHYQEALRLFQEGGTIDLVPSSLHQIGVVYKGMKKFERALDYFQQCVRLSHILGKTRNEAYALDEIAQIYANQGKHRQAFSLYSEILRTHVSIKDPRGQALVLNSIGNLHLTLDHKKKAVDAFQQALQFSELADDRSLMMDTLFNLARAERARNSLDDAKLHIEHSINMIETIRTNVASPDNRSSYFSGLRQHYDLYIALLMQLERLRPGQGFVEMALIASERARARAFLELFMEAGVDIRQGVDPAVLQREKELQSMLAWHARTQLEKAASPQTEDQAALDESLTRLKAEREQLQAEVRNQSPRYQTLARPKPLTIADIQAQLGKDDLVLEYILAEEQSFVWAITSTSIDGYELDSKSKLEAAAREVHKLIVARQATVVDDEYQANVRKADDKLHDKALALSQMLFKPVAAISGKKRLVIVTEGFLQYIPYDALPPPNATSQTPDLQRDKFHNLYMLSDYEFVILPSISTLAAIRAESGRISSSSGLVAVFADPVYTRNDDRVNQTETSKDLAFADAGSPAFRSLTSIRERGGLRRLTYSSDEADKISAAASGDALVVKGFEATRENVMTEALARYQIVHFATHGVVNTKDPELSMIVLTMIKPDGTPVNGLLQLHDIFNLKLSAELTVLSACDTGLGQDVRGEGLIGLTRGLMFAGSRTVVASLWKVDDRATAVLMGHFYKAMLQDGMPRSAALRYAKEQLRKEPEWSAPFFWAGFVLQGEYDKPIVIEHKSRVWPGVIVLVVLAVISGSLLLLRRFAHR